jgi:hypothetical protein
MEQLVIFNYHLVYFTAIGNTYGHLVYFVVSWYIFPRFGILYQEKSGNPAQVFINKNHLRRAVSCRGLKLLCNKNIKYALGQLFVSFVGLGAEEDAALHPCYFTLTCSDAVVTAVSTAFQPTHLRVVITRHRKTYVSNQVGIGNW